VSAAARRSLALVVAILLAAAGLRSYRLIEIPPGVEHDEVAEWQIARGILAGQHALFFRQAYGQEPLYLYLQAASISALGDNVFALRFTSFAAAMLALAACFRVTRRLFGATAALVSLALMAVALWPLFFARVAIRGMTLPLVLCLGADALFSNLKSQVSSLKSPLSNRRWIMAGVWFGLAAYTYLAVRAAPILLVGFVAYLALFAREQMRGKWRGLAAALILAALVAAPLAVYLWRNPDVQFRVGEVSAPLDKLLRGDPSDVLTGVRDTALMFSVRGDQTVRDNWPDRPVFADPLSAALFYLGLGVALWRWRKPEYAFVLLWLVALLAPTVVTAAPPNFVRTLGALPPIFALPGIGAVALFNGMRFVHRRGAEKSYRILCGLGVSAVIGIGLALTIRDYFLRWPAHPETQFVWQTDLASVAHYLDSTRDVPTDVAISGLSNESMDNDSLSLLMRRRDLAVRWFDSRTTLVIPPNAGSLFIPQIVPLDPLLRARLILWGAQEHRDPSGRFAWFDLSNVHAANVLTTTVLPDGRSMYLDTPLYNGMFFLHYETSNPQVKPGGELTALTYWQATLLPLPPLKAFVHLTDSNGKLVAQSDGLNAPPQFWRAGDVIVQLHRFQVPPDAAPGVYQWTVGLYESQTLARVQFKPEGDQLRLPDVKVVR
jgi:4-amino-4-deoxy-L-arabinose transferase-like glycosyltransferase